MARQLGWMDVRNLPHWDVLPIVRKLPRGLVFAGAAWPLTRIVEPVLAALALTGAMTLCLLAATQLIELRHVSIAYLVPVLVAAISLGIAPAIMTAAFSIAASAFFFYPPIWDLRISDPQQVLDVVLFIAVAIATGKIAGSARSHAMHVEDQERAMRTLYAFSKRLAVATEEAQIYAAIEDHLSTITNCRVAYYAAHANSSFRETVIPPEPVQGAVLALLRESGARGDVWVDEGFGRQWLVRAVSRTNTAYGLVAVDLGDVPMFERVSLQKRIDAALTDAVGTLERLDMARIIAEAKLRAQAETLRTALIGSVSHALRTPLASIMGSASILVQAPCIVQDQQLAALAEIVRDEADKLNCDIQKLLDASRISSAGLRPHFDWADPADIVHAAVARHRRTSLDARFLVDLPEHLPIVRIDPILVEQALNLVLENAIKYAPEGSTNSLGACGQAGEISIYVRDQGIGLSVEERAQIFERFYRSPRAEEMTSGSGLGLWIAQAFIDACGGRIEAASPGVGSGATIIITLRVNSSIVDSEDNLDG